MQPVLDTTAVTTPNLLTVASATEPVLEPVKVAVSAAAVSDAVGDPVLGLGGGLVWGGRASPAMCCRHCR